MTVDPNSLDLTEYDLPPSDRILGIVNNPTLNLDPLGRRF